MIQGGLNKIYDVSLEMFSTADYQNADFFDILRLQNNTNMNEYLKSLHL